MKLKITTAALVFALTLQARGGGEGPCPVPEVPLPQVVQKNYLATQRPIADMVLFDEQETLLLRHADASYERKRFGDSVVSFLPEDFGLFLRPGAITQLASFDTKALPAWTDRVERIEAKVGALLQKGWRRDRYDSVTFSSSGSIRRLCQTPAVRGLRLADGGDRGRAYFYSWRASGLRVFRQDLHTCDWREEANYRRLPKSIAGQLIWFGDRAEGFYLSGSGLVRVSSEGFKTFEVEAKKMFFLSAGTPALLLWSELGRLSLFMTETESAATLLSRVKEFSASAIAYSESKRKLFLPLRIESESSGVYEFTLR